MVSARGEVRAMMAIPIRPKEDEGLCGGVSLPWLGLPPRPRPVARCGCVLNARWNWIIRSWMVMPLSSSSTTGLSEAVA